MHLIQSREYNPLTYFWIAFYKDKTALSQFDPDTGEEFTFDKVDHSRLAAFGWFPFSTKLSLTILEKTDLITRPSENPTLMLELKPGQKLVAHRENQIINYGFHKCKCGNVWQFQRGEPNPYIKLTRSMKAYIEKIEVTTEEGPSLIRFINPICPSCGYHDSNAVTKDDKQIRRGSGNHRVTRYILGVQGQRPRFIDESGKTGLLKKIRGKRRKQNG